jgi:hypothetical protein
MTVDEDNFTIALHDLADRDAVTAPPTAQLVRRAVRARRARIAAVVAAALAVVAAGGVTAGLGHRGAATTVIANPTAAAAAPGDTPALELVAAVQASAQTSFRFTITTGGRSVEYGKEKTMREALSTGAYDPRVPKGYLTPGRIKTAQRLIGTVLYEQKGDKWFKVPGDGGLRLEDSLNTGPLNPLATDFVDQFAALQKAGTATKTGPTSYRFAFTWKPGDPDRPDTIPVTGTIQLDPKSHLVTAMSYDYMLAYPKGEADAKFYYSVDWTYSDYGSPFDVEVPPVTKPVLEK